MAVILGLDTETTGLSASEHRLTEVGMILWDTEVGMIHCVGFLVNAKQSIPDEIVKLNGITDSVIEKWGCTEHTAMMQIDAASKRADYICAHNAPFDRGFVEELFKRCNWEAPKTPWINSSTDIPYPDSMNTRKLVHLASEHGFVNPFPHRAVTDVLTMLRICDEYGWEEIIELSTQPTITLRAKVSFDEKEKARTNGYRWNADKKLWLKDIKEKYLEREEMVAKNAGFEFARCNN